MLGKDLFTPSYLVLWFLLIILSVSIFFVWVSRKWSPRDGDYITIINMKALWQKVENAHHQQYLLLPKCFPTLIPGIVKTKLDFLFTFTDQKVLKLIHFYESEGIDFFKFRYMCTFYYYKSNTKLRTLCFLFKYKTLHTRSQASEMLIV